MSSLKPPQGAEFLRMVNEVEAEQADAAKAAQLESQIKSITGTVIKSEQILNDNDRELLDLCDTARLTLEWCETQTNLGAYMACAVILRKLLLKIQVNPSLPQFPAALRLPTIPEAK